jgi:hypothetical protein
MAITPGACVDEPDQVAAMLQQTHDGLIEMTGALRRSGVSWKRARGYIACMNLLAELYPPPVSDDVDSQLQKFRDFFEGNPFRCMLIVAFCEIAT